MKIKPSLLLLAIPAVFLAGCNYSPKPASMLPAIQQPPITATPTPTPTKEQTLNELNTQLNTTVDDGGAADLNQLKTESQGL